MTDIRKSEARYTYNGAALTGRPLEIAEYVHSRNGVWDAFDQGRLARALGELHTANPWRVTGLPYHVNMSDWERGWSVEDERPQVAGAF